MEKILNDNEKIRKAEEIYYRRNSKALPKKKIVKVTNNIKDKILLNLLLMFNITVVIFCIQNNRFIFSQEFLSMLNKYNIDISSKIIGFVDNFIKDDKGDIETESVKNENIQIEESNINARENVIIQNNQVEEENTLVKNETNISSMSEMELDIINLKAAYSFIKPVEDGILTSNFGSRVSDNPNINGYHTGTDFAAETGTDIKASMQGIVTEVSNDGNYGKHFKIRCNNVITVYAHCSEIYVKEGQIVAQGQVVGAVGSTGNSTGPHLHFEIRIDDRFVNPEKIL